MGRSRADQLRVNATEELSELVGNNMPPAAGKFIVGMVIEHFNDNFCISDHDDLAEAIDELISETVTKRINLAENAQLNEAIDEHIQECINESETIDELVQEAVQMEVDKVLKSTKNKNLLREAAEEAVNRRLGVA